MKGLLFITHQTVDYTYIDSVEIALAGGCRQIQLRMKELSEAEAESLAFAAKERCERAGASLYIDDRVELCRRVSATGVHLGKLDMPPAEARRLLGPGFVIGGTANSLADIQALQQAGVNYIGLGPFRFTETKKNLSPVLHLSGYKEIMESMCRLGISLPVVAIGGITAADIPELLSLGVSGIALSSTILRAADPVGETKKIIDIIQQEQR